MCVEKVKLLFGSICSGAIFAIAWPSIGGMSTIIFGAFIPLLWVEFQLTEKGRSALAVFLHAYLAFFVFNLTTTWWIKNADLMGATMAVFCNSFFMATVFWLFHLTKKYVGKKEGYIGLVIYWLAFEYLHLNWELSWTWLTFGNAFAESIQSVQWYEYTGVLGGSLWVLVVNLLLFKSIKEYQIKAKFNSRLFFLSLLLILIPSLFGKYMFSTYKETGKKLEFVIVQPNIDPYGQKFSGMSNSAQIDKMYELAIQKIGPETDYLILPETSIPEPEWEHTVTFSDGYEVFKGLINQFPKLKIVVGINSTVLFAPGMEVPKDAEFHETIGYYQSYNTALYLDSSDNLQFHHKSKLVLGVEKLPFIDLLPIMKKLSIKLGGSSGRIGTQPIPSVFTSEGSVGRLAPIICYESIYGEYVTQYAKQKSNVFAIITNDGWWENTPGYKQHIAYASLRAIENRRSIARSANTGTSAFINQKGEILEATNWWEEAVIKGTLKTNEKITFYAKYGDYLGRITGFLAPLLLLLTLVKKLNKTGQRLSSSKA